VSLRPAKSSTGSPLLQQGKLDFSPAEQRSILERASESVLCENWVLFAAAERACGKSAPPGRLSLAQHGAAGGVLGKVGNWTEPHRGVTGSHTDSLAPVLDAGAKAQWLNWTLAETVKRSFPRINAGAPTNLPVQDRTPKVEERLWEFGRPPVHITCTRDLRPCPWAARRGINELEDRVVVSLAAAPSVQAGKGSLTRQWIMGSWIDPWVWLRVHNYSPSQHSPKLSNRRQLQLVSIANKEVAYKTLGLNRLHGKVS